MRKTFAMVLCAVLATAAFSGPVQGQVSEFKITDYIPEKFREFRWQIRGSAGLSGEDFDSKSYNTPTDYYLSQIRHRETNSYNTGLNSNLWYDYETVPQFLNLNVRFVSWLNNRNSEVHQRSTFSGYPGAGTTGFSESSNRRYEFDLRPSVDAGRYLMKDFFVSGTFSGFFNYRESPDDESRLREDALYLYDTLLVDRMREMSSAGNSDNRHLAVTLTLLPGWGRLYEGNYASTAMYMIEELRKNGALLREPTSDEMLRLCDLVYQNRLVDPIDERLQRIETFDEILGYLADVGITDAAGSKGFLYIQDVWDFFPHDRRQFGLRGRLGLSFEHRHSRSRASSDVYDRGLETRTELEFPYAVDTSYYYDEYRYSYANSNTEVNNLYLQGQVEYGRPLSRQWQLDINGTLRYYLDCGTTDKRDQVYYRQSEDGDFVQTSRSEQREDTDKSYQLSFAPSLAYIYSSRTRLDIGAVFTRSMMKTERTSYDEDGELLGTTFSEQGRVELDIAASLAYRIAIPTTLTVTAEYNYDSPSSQYFSVVDGLPAAPDKNSEYVHRYTIGVSVSHYLY